MKTTYKNLCQKCLNAGLAVQQFHTIQQSMIKKVNLTSTGVTQNIGAPTVVKPKFLSPFPKYEIYISPI